MPRTGQTKDAMDRSIRAIGAKNWVFTPDRVDLRSIPQFLLARVTSTLTPYSMF